MVTLRCAWRSWCRRSAVDRCRRIADSWAASSRNMSSTPFDLPMNRFCAGITADLLHSACWPARQTARTQSSGCNGDKERENHDRSTFTTHAAPVDESCIFLPGSLAAGALSPRAGRSPSRPPPSKPNPTSGTASLDAAIKAAPRLREARTDRVSTAGPRPVTVGRRQGRQHRGLRRHRSRTTDPRQCRRRTRIVLTNKLDQKRPCTGRPALRAMDGAALPATPNVPAGESFIYKFSVPDPGTYWASHRRPVRHRPLSATDHRRPQRCADYGAGGSLCRRLDQRRRQVTAADLRRSRSKWHGCDGRRRYECGMDGGMEPGQMSGRVIASD